MRNIYMLLSLIGRRLHVFNSAPKATSHSSIMTSRRKANYVALAALVLIVAISYADLATKQTNTAAKATASTSSPKAAADVMLNTPTTSTITPAVPSTSDLGSSATTDSTSNASMQVTVNGQNVAIPSNGSVSQTVPAANGNGQTNVSISNTHSNTGNSHSYNFSSTQTSTSSTNNNVDVRTERTSE